jgi:hypothetical protein
LTYTVNSNLDATFQYRFRVKAINEYLKESIYSRVATYYAAPLPDQVVFPADPFTSIEEDSLTFEWDQPTVDLNVMLPILTYNIYWDAGYLLTDRFVLLDQVLSYDQTFYEVTDNLTSGRAYKFQVSAVNAIGEGPLLAEIESFA